VTRNASGTAEARAGGSARQSAHGALHAALFESTANLPLQFARYLAVGGVAFAADFGTLYVLTEFARLHYLVSAAVGFLLGLALNYLLSRVWVFDRRSMDSATAEFVVFALIGIVGLGMNEGIIWFVRERIHFHYLVAKAISAGIVLVWNFGARKALLFSERPAPGFLRRLMPPYERASLASAGMAAACVAFCLGVQGFCGAWSAAFLAYPDEPSHFVGSVMLRDWLVSGRWLVPLQFARDYYQHYPFFAIGYWPPLFNLVAGLWMLAAGVGRVQVLLIPAVCAAGTGWLVFGFVRRRAGIVAGFCAGALYLSLPPVQRWMCAVMVDHMTAFLCLAVAACLLRYLKQPALGNGVLCAAACGCAILSKYSAAYTPALPFLAVLVLRRFELLRKPSLLVQPLVVALMVGPWAIWSRRLAFYGLPSEREALTLTRAASFLLETLRMFPPVLMGAIVLGLIALLLRPKAWREDLVVLGLLFAGHLAFLFVSPVGPEHRYLLVLAAVLLVAGFAGWSEMLAWMSPGRRWAGAVSVCAVILTVAFAVSQFGRVPRIPPSRIGEVVAFIARDTARAGQRVMAPPALEGPVIAEFVAQSRHRPDHYVLRPGKEFAHSDWFGRKYSSAFATPEEMMQYFRRNPVDLIVWNEPPGAALPAHARIMGEMLRRYPASWHSVLSLGPVDNSASSWTIYEYRAQPGDPL
jgi:putative flippase GtrA